MRKSSFSVLAARFLLIMALLLSIGSCASSSYARKCNGTRGTRVPMGVM